MEVSAIFNVLTIMFLLIRRGASIMPVKMMEETAVNTQIGDVLSFIQANYRNNQLQYSCDSKFFSITDTGKLIVSQIIDLETLCLQQKLCCGDSVCNIDANVLISNNEKNIIENVELKVQILDKNDHKPSFSSAEQNVMISEFSQIGVLISLTPATDGDATAENRIQNYRLTEPTGCFSLDVSRLPSIALRITKKLDYEDKNRFDATLQACDPEVCMTQALIIYIKDENDNQPAFELDSYNISVKEDVVIGSTIGQVKANDKDSLKYGEIQYLISVDSDQDLKSTFIVDSRSGRIQLRQKLSTNVRDFYKLRVLARDSDPLNPKQAMCYVTIKIVDVNDHSPIIKTLPVAGPLNMSENIPPRHITTLKIVDYDQGKNAIVQCRLDPNCEGSFELISNSKNVYSLKTLRQFDHEQEQKVDAIIICKDQGEPSLETVKVIPLYINDVNEYKPHFKPNDPEGFYRTSIIENSPQGVKVITVTAYDKDKSATLSYQIDNSGSEYFRIDSRTGEIRCANKELDRERMPSVTFTVQVTDSVIDPKTVNVQVRITVLDANDNSPVFPLNLPQFSVIENSAPMKLDGQLTAKDDDQDENAMISFSLQNTWNSHTLQRHEGLFHVTNSGNLETLTSLDREKCDSYIIEVTATDSARSPQLPLSTKVNITVTIHDQNDNAPMWTYPELNVYNISDSMRPGDQLFQLRAHDIDIGVNGKLKFEIVSQYRQEKGSLKSSGSSSQYFIVNSTTGHLAISQILYSGTVIINFRASDYGQPMQSEMKKFTINISGDDSSNLNMTIIAVMITVTAVISLFLIVAIICVRRKPPKYHSPASSILTKDQPVPDWIGLRAVDESMIAFQPGNKSPYISGTLRATSTVPNNEGTLQMHTFTPNCLPYEPIDGDSGDSGKGPSEEGSNPQHPNHEGSNYYSLHQSNRGSFRPCIPVPTSPTRSACHCYVLPEESIIQPGYSGLYSPVYSQSGDTFSLISPSPAGYSSSYSSFSLPRNQYPVSRQRINSNSNSNSKFQHYNGSDSSNLTSSQSTVTSNNSPDCPTPRVYSRLTPMHMRRVSEQDVDPGMSSAQEKIVLHNDRTVNNASSPSYTESVEA